MQLSGTLRGGVVALCVVLLAVCGCSHQKAQQKQTPEQLFKTAKKDLANNNFNGAIKAYESLTARFPFADEARQARIDLIYAYYRAGEKESATDAADAFIRENPAHPRVDYAYYMKGMVDFERSPNAIERIFHADLTQRPPTDARKSFASFKIVVEQYPKSEYAHDALQRMVYLRDRLASYDVHVARYYLKRGAYVAAAQRARGVVDQYQGAPAVQDALAIMIECYDKLGLEPLAAQSRQVYAANFSAGVRESAAVAKRSWWKFW
jgi:outer membrane protein assembly factor BamD